MTTSPLLRRPARTDRPPWRWLLLVPLVLVEFALATAAAVEPRIAFTLVIAGAFAVLALIAPVAVLVAAVAGLYGFMRVGPAAINMSATDALTLLGTLAALPYVPWRSKELRAVFLALALYLAFVAVSVIASPSRPAGFELLHRTSMVLGPLLIGSALGALGKARLALRVFVGVGMVFASVAVLQTLTSGFAPAYPLGMHKNAAGAHLATAILILLAGSARLELRRWQLLTAWVVLVGGLLATQSRGAALALVAAAAFYLARAGGRRVARVAPLFLVLSVVLLGFAISSFEGSRDGPADQHGSLESRLDLYTYAIDHAWKPHIPFGSGPRWFIVNGVGDSGPHNIVVAELSETGVAGLCGLTVLLGTMLVVLWRARDDLSTTAFLIVVERVLDSMLGFLWVAGTGTVPFLMTGVALGDIERQREHEPDQAVLADR